MTNKHRIAIALMASLGLLTFGAKNTNAKSNAQPSNQTLIHQTKVVNKAHNNLPHLPKTLSQSQIKRALSNIHNRITKLGQPAHKTSKAFKVNKTNSVKPANKLAKKADHSSTKSASKSAASAHFGHAKKTADKSTGYKLMKKVHSDKLNAKFSSHHKHNGMKHSDVDHHHSAHVDNNEHNIGGMNQFTNFRHHYLYNQIGGNTRDLGGYPADHGKYRIAPDRIIRSADLDGLSQSGIKTLKHLHVNKVIDLRYYTGKDGIQGHPDPSELRSKDLEGTQIGYQLDPVYTHTEAHQFGKYMKAHNEHGEYYFYGNLSVSKPQAIKTYRKVFRDLLNNHNGAILFHCNLGRDRTGVTSALILSALGVNRNVIYHDYLLTYRYHYHFSANSPAYAKHAAELQYFFKTIDSKYGSVKSYLSNEIGLNHSKLMKLRKMYLVPNK